MIFPTVVSSWAAFFIGLVICLGMVVCGRVVDLVEGVELVLGGETVSEDAVQKMQRLDEHCQGCTIAKCMLVASSFAKSKLSSLRHGNPNVGSGQPEATFKTNSVLLPSKSLIIAIMARRSYFSSIHCCCSASRRIPSLFRRDTPLGAGLASEPWGDTVHCLAVPACSLI